MSYTLAFAGSAALFGLGLILAMTLLPSIQRLRELRVAVGASATAQAADAVTIRA